MVADFRNKLFQQLENREIISQNTFVHWSHPIFVENKEVSLSAKQFLNNFFLLLNDSEIKWSVAVVIYRIYVDFIL